MKLMAAVCAPGGRMIRRISGRTGVSSACAMLILVAGGLSADSLTPPSGGFLYSQYLKQFSPAGERIETGETGISAGSFIVRSSRPFYASGGDAAGAALQSELDSLPLNRWAADLWNDNEGSAGAAALDHARGAAWRLGDSVADSFLLAATEDALAQGTLRNVGVELLSDLGERNAHASFYALGSIKEGVRDATAWEVRAYTGGGDGGTGGNAGLIYRRALRQGMLGEKKGQSLVGMNVFLDYAHSEDLAEGQDGGGFYRWSAGGEYRSAWLDFSTNFYFGITDPATAEASDGEGSYWIYTADGQDAEVAVHSPHYPEFALIAGYYRWEGELGANDEDGLRAGLRVRRPFQTPFSGRLEFEDTDTDRDWGGRISFDYQFGKPPGVGFARLSEEFVARDWFFAPIERTYSQRIRTTRLPREFTWTLAGIGIEGRAVSLKSADITATVSRQNGSLVVAMNGSPVDMMDEGEWLIPTRLPITLYVPRGSQATATYHFGPAQGTVVIMGTAVLGERTRALLVDGMMVVSVGNGQFFAGGRASDDATPSEIALMRRDADVGLSVASRTEGASTSFEALLEGGSEASPSVACAGTEEMIGRALNVVCAVDPYFVANSGERIAGVYAARGNFHENRDIAMVSVMGGVTLSLGYSVSVSGTPAGLAYDPAVSAVILSSGASVGDTLELTLVADDESDRAPAATAALTVLVARLDFNRMSAAIVPPVQDAFAYRMAPRVVATVLYGGGSGSLTLSVERSEGALILNEANGEISLPSALTGSLAIGQLHVLVVAVSDANSSNENRPVLATASVVISRVLNQVAFEFQAEDGSPLTAGLSADSRLEINAPESGRSVVAALSATPGQGTITYALLGAPRGFEIEGGPDGNGEIYILPEAEDGDTPNIAVVASSDAGPLPNTLTLYVEVPYSDLSATLASDGIVSFEGAGRHVATFAISGGSGNYAVTTGGGSHADISCLPGGVISLAAARRAPGDVLDAVCEISDTASRNAGVATTLSARLSVSLAVNHISIVSPPATLLVASNPFVLSVEGPFLTLSLAANSIGNGLVEFVRLTGSSGQLSVDSAGAVSYGPEAEPGVTLTLVAEARDAGAFSDASENDLVTLYARAPYLAADFLFSPELTASIFSFPAGDPAVFSTVRVTNVSVSLAIETGALSVAPGATDNESILSVPPGLPSGNYEFTVIASYLNPLNVNGPSSSHPGSISVTAIENVEVNSLSFGGSATLADPPPLISLEYSPLPQVVATIVAEAGVGDYRHSAIAAQTDSDLSVDPALGVVVAAGRAIGPLSMVVSVADGGDAGDSRTFDALVTISVSVGDPPPISAWLADPDTGVSLTAGASSADPLYVLFTSLPRDIAVISIFGGTGEYALDGPVPEGDSFIARLSTGNAIYAGTLAVPGSDYGVTVSIVDVGTGAAGTGDVFITMFFRASPRPVIAGFEGDIVSGSTVTLEGITVDHVAATLRGDSSRLSWEAVESSDVLELNSDGGAVSVVYRADNAPAGGGLYSIVARATYTNADDAANVPIFLTLHVDVRSATSENRIRTHIRPYGEGNPLAMISGQSANHHAGRLAIPGGLLGEFQEYDARLLMRNSGRGVEGACARARFAALSMAMGSAENSGCGVVGRMGDAAAMRRINGAFFRVSPVAKPDDDGASAIAPAAHEFWRRSHAVGSRS